MHCLPAHRGEEVAASVVDGPQSSVFPQAHNRLHAFRGLLRFLLEDGDMTTKAQRQHRIAKLLAEQSVTSQAHLVELLAAEDVQATQATVSRDLEDLGAIKVRVAGATRSTPSPSCRPSSGPPRTTCGASSATGSWRSTTPATSSCSARPPGSAHVVGSALDRSGLPGVLGTVAGDDTLIIVTSEQAGGAAVARQLSDLAGL